MLAIVAEGDRGRLYLSPTEDQEAVAQSIARDPDAPDTPLPDKALGFRIQGYGFSKHAEIFTSRQLHMMVKLAQAVRDVEELVLSDARTAGLPDDDVRLEDGGAGAQAYSEAVVAYLACALSRTADFNNSLCRWKASGEQVMGMFGRQTVSMVWDFAEANILLDRGVSWRSSCNIVADVLDRANLPAGVAAVRQTDASKASYSGQSLLLSTDPPYYDNIGYADLSDFFYIWLRQACGHIFRRWFSTVLTPKAEELIASAERFGNDEGRAKEHFERGFRAALDAVREHLDPRFPATIYYAFRQQEEETDGDGTEPIITTTGWETMLEALIAGGFAITGTWPVTASQTWRLRSRESNALGTYIVLVCRPRLAAAALTTRRDFARELRRQLPDALKSMQEANIAPVDLPQAAIGPGMAIFSQYRRILEPDGKQMSVRTGLSLVNQVVDEIIAEYDAELDSDTRWAIGWFEQYGFDDGPYGAAENLARGRNTSLRGLEEAGVAVAARGHVHLIGREELDPNWDPRTDTRLTVWKVAQHMMLELDHGGEQAAAALLAMVGGFGESTRSFAYRLYGICQRRNWPKEAVALNQLVLTWPELTRLAAQVRLSGGQTSFLEST